MQQFVSQNLNFPNLAQKGNSENCGSHPRQRDQYLTLARFLVNIYYAGCLEGAYRVKKRVDFFFFFFFTRDALKEHTVSKNGSISFYAGCPEEAYRV